MQFSYPYIKDSSDGATLVSFPDVPGAVTEIRAEENERAVINDCLLAALGGYMARRKEPPLPSPARGRPVVTLDLVTSAKLALANEMSQQGISNVALAAHLGVTEKVVRRLLDPDHRCRIDRLEAALAALGRQVGLVVERGSRVA
jgi:antitoxin HicB